MSVSVSHVNGAAIYHADNGDVLPGLSGFDACVTDPPYELSFMGKAWDGTGIAFRPEFWATVLDALKPGAHLLAFGGTRTYHRMACAIEDAGFEIRDCILFMFGTGFPKSLNLPGGIGTALKPAYEPIILARKPLQGTVAANVLAHGTGGLNIDASRVLAASGDYASGGKNDLSGTGWGHKNDQRTEQHALGRWPANVLHDGSDEVEAAFAAFGERKSTGGQASNFAGFGKFGGGSRVTEKRDPGFGDTGTASRFFYSAKASKSDRAGSKHPTVKPLALMRYLCRLVTPPGGHILDPFAGSGTTLQAAVECGFRVTGIEREDEYAADVMRRLAANESVPPLQRDLLSYAAVSA